MREACELFPNSVFNGKHQKYHKFFFFFNFSSAAFMSFMVLFLSCFPHVPPLYLQLFQCCLCPTKLCFGICCPAACRRWGKGNRGMQRLFFLLDSDSFLAFH